MSDRAYVYEILVDGMRRYVGKGSGDRAQSHFRAARAIRRRREAGEKVKTSIFYNHLIKAMNRDAKVDVRFVVRGVSHEDAFDREVQEIAAGEPNQLWNVLAGGPSGSVILPEHREKLSAIAKQRYSDPAERRKMATAQEETNRRPEIKAKRSEATRRILQKTGGKERLHRGLMNAFADPEFMAWFRENQKVQWTPERRDAFGQESISRWKDAERKERQRRTLRQSWADPERKARWRAYVDSPEGRAKLSAASKARWANRQPP